MRKKAAKANKKSPPTTKPAKAAKPVANKTATRRTTASVKTAGKNPAKRLSAKPVVKSARKKAQPSYPAIQVRLTDASQAEELSAWLFEFGAAGVEERDAHTLTKSEFDGTILIGHFATEDAAKIAVAALESDGHAAVFAPVVGDGWKTQWKAFFRPTRVGKHIIVRPPWETMAKKKGDIELVIDPGLAFGTGTHQTTRLVLAELEKVIKKGQDVLDVGSGTGILSIAARKLGAKSALGLDIDDESMAAARKNAKRNGVTAFVAKRTALADIKHAYPLVLANIESRILIPIKVELARVVGSKGILVLCGILAPEEQEVLEAFDDGLGLSLVRTSYEGEWVCAVFKKS